MTVCIGTKKLNLKGTMSVVQVPLTKGKFALVDLVDWFEVSKYRWHAQKCSYRESAYYARWEYDSSGPNRKAIFLHNLLIKPEEGQCADHINGDGLDNRRYNLRIIDKNQNMFNRIKSKNKTSKFKGVYWASDRQKWRACIRLNKTLYNLGQFINEIDAATKYDSMASVMFGELAKLNFPEGGTK